MGVAVSTDSVREPGRREGHSHNDIDALSLNDHVNDYSTCDKDSWLLQEHRAPRCPGTGRNNFGFLPSTLK